jgi:hypothetical protein
MDDAPERSRPSRGLRRLWGHYAMWSSDDFLLLSETWPGSLAFLAGHRGLTCDGRTRAEAMDARGRPQETRSATTTPSRVGTIVLL